MIYNDLGFAWEYGFVFWRSMIDVAVVHETIVDKSVGWQIRIGLIGGRVHIVQCDSEEVAKRMVGEIVGNMPMK